MGDVARIYQRLGWTLEWSGRRNTLSPIMLTYPLRVPPNIVHMAHLSTIIIRRHSASHAVLTYYIELRVWDVS